MARTLKQGDTSQWKFKLMGVSGDGAFSGSTAKLSMRPRSGGSAKIDGVKLAFADASSAESSTDYGVVTYSPSTSDVDVAGIFRAEIEVNFSDGTRSRFPSDGFHRIEINESIM